MQNEAAPLYCPNDLCQAANPLNNKFCQQCRTPLTKRYLWAVGEGIEAYKPGDVVGDRYLVKELPRILLDTKPALSPQIISSESSELLKPYLRLFAYRIQVPQVYGAVTLEDHSPPSEILLLEEVAIYTDASQLEGQLMPQLSSVWQDQSSMRQLNWLWQIATLWQPLSAQGVASSLLDERLLRQEDSKVRLLELQLDVERKPTLAQLGQLWSQWCPGAKRAIAEFLQQLCQQMIQGEVHSYEQLVAILDRALLEVGRSLAPTRTIRIATKSDQGPSRQRNEDACYPPSGRSTSQPPDRQALAIVCDGIGGHEGGNVASNLAIETIQQHLSGLAKLPPEHLDPATLTADLEYAAAAANDRISQRNDSEHRHGRQRMGTTLVMGLPIAHEIYIAHVGDSRAYWITRNGCHQVTLDDDVASREVRLGYATYRDALEQASSGSLVQALGMNASSSLHPTVQRFILDEDCVFLLCSDGLSDYDRVDQCWETEILPILDGKVDVSTASQSLVELANTQNGHDNATVAIVYCQVTSKEPLSPLSPEITSSVPMPVESAIADTSPDLGETPTILSSAPSTLQTQIRPSPPAGSKRFILGGLLTILLLIGGGVLAYLFLPPFQSAVDPLIGLTPSPLPTSVGPTTPSPVVPVPAKTPAGSSLQPGTLIKIKAIGGSAETPPRDLLLRSGLEPEQPPVGIIPGGAQVQVKQQVARAVENEPWLQLKICSIPNSARQLSRSFQNPVEFATQTAQTRPSTTTESLSPSPPFVRQGTEGWISVAELKPFISSTSKAAQPVECGAPKSQTPTPPKKE